MPSWELLASRCVAKLSEDVNSFANVVRIYTMKVKVNKHNQDHMLRLDSAVIYARASNEGRGAAQAYSQVAGNLSKSFPVCVGCRVMMTRNIWDTAGLVNGAKGNVYDVSWQEGSDFEEHVPQVIIVALDNYTGPPFQLPSGEVLRDFAGKLVVSVKRVRQDFSICGETCFKKQFPLIICYIITVYTS
ncbi:hypothetical protein F4819DRAFT_507582 [Hypoxylon fuscum]|nr:hypothetical protein F4819DRAFT_507582 [Hypoxylon fuscum]